MLLSDGCQSISLTLHGGLRPGVWSTISFNTGIYGVCISAVSGCFQNRALLQGSVTPTSYSLRSTYQTSKIRVQAHEWADPVRRLCQVLKRPGLVARESVETYLGTRNSASRDRMSNDTSVIASPSLNRPTIPITPRVSEHESKNPRRSPRWHREHIQLKQDSKHWQGRIVRKQEDWMTHL